MFSSTKPLIFFFLFSLLAFCAISNAKSPPKLKAFTFPISKDVTTNQYFTNIQIGRSNITKFNVVIDLGGRFLWFNSDDYFNSAISSYSPLKCKSKLCKIIDGGCNSCFMSPPVPGCTNKTCADYSYSPFTGRRGYSGMGLESLHVYSTSGDKYNLKRFPFQFSDPVMREGLGSSSAGVIGLGRSILSLQAQLASSFKISQKFALCIPSSGNNGTMIIGENSPSGDKNEISKSLMTTPLIRNPVSTDENEWIGNFTVEYFINVRAILVDNKSLSFNNSLLSIDTSNGGGGTSLRTARPYTSLVRPIYRVLVREFVKAAASKNITRVASVAPFAACFDSKSIATGKTGPQVPIIDLVLEEKNESNVNWRLYGSNSVVRVSNNVTCLAFVEEQPNITGPTTSVVVGGYQMENYLLEFDLPSSRLRFSPSLVLRDTSCSRLQAS